LLDADEGNGLCFCTLDFWIGGGSFWFVLAFHLIVGARPPHPLHDFTLSDSLDTTHGITLGTEGSMEGNHGASACIVLAFPTQQSWGAWFCGRIILGFFFGMERIPFVL
jgi:hypothetical protein